MSENINDWLTPIKGGTGYQRNFSVTEEDAPMLVEALVYHLSKHPSRSVSKVIVRAIIDNAHTLKELEGLGE